MPKFEHIFFDLDHTLWDFVTNSRETLGELHKDFELSEFGIDRGEFIEVYEEINQSLWDQYSIGKIDKAVLRVLRFRKAFAQFGIADNRLSNSFGKAYVDQCPRKSALMPGAIELLDWLYGEAQVPLCVITNGFSEVQEVKMKQSGITHYFDAVITSELAGAKKPSKRIFEVALRRMDAKPERGLMVGDNQVADIIGANQVGMQTIHLDVHDKHEGSPATMRVSTLEHVRPWLAAR